MAETSISRRLSSKKTKLGVEHLKVGRKPSIGPPGYLDLGDGGSIGYFPNYFPHSKDLVNQLKEEVVWERRKIRIFGKEVYQPRLISYMADDSSLEYTYSQLTLTPREFTPTVLKIKQELEKLLGVEFNCVLGNFYRDGQDCMGWHSDNEAVFGRHPIIGSVSFGQKRAFDIRNSHNLKFHLRYMLGEGDVVVMQGTMQDNWKHSVVATKPTHEARINLTFRKILFPKKQLPSNVHNTSIR